MSTYGRAYRAFGKARDAGVLGYTGIIQLRGGYKREPYEVWSAYTHLCTFKTGKALLEWIEQCTAAGHFVKPAEGYIGINKEAEITARIDADIAARKANGQT